MFEITALDYDCPPLHLYVYTSCKRPSIYGQPKNTNNHPPPVKKSAFIICNVLQCLCVRSRCLLIACLLFQRFCRANGDPANSKRCQYFFSLFLSVTSLCIHTDPCLVCSLGGTHHTQQRLNTRCTRFDCALWTCIKGHLWSWIQSHGCLNHAVILHDQCAFYCDETLTCYAFIFSVEIFNLPT